MTLKIKLEKDSERVWATDMFSIVGDVDFVKLGNVLDRIKYFVGNNQQAFKNINNHVLFDITDNGHKYEYMLLDLSNTHIPFLTIINAVESATGMKVDEIMTKSKKIEYIKARAVLFSALRFFSHSSVLWMQNRFGLDHATILHSTNKSLPSFIRSKDEYVVGCVTNLSSLFNSSLYFNTCKTGKFIDI